MATVLHNLSEYDSEKLPSAEGKRFVIIVSEWNGEITKNLHRGAYETLLAMKAMPSHIKTIWTPGAYELPLAALRCAKDAQFDAIICLGCVIEGETRHFEFICDSVAHGIMRVMLDYSLPIGFGVLTARTLVQAQQRAGGRHGNKGVEAAVAVLKMI